MTNRKVAALASAATLALVLSSCAQSERDDGGGDAGSTGDTAEGDPDATLIFGAAGEPAHFDPFYASDGETFRPARQMYETLIAIEPGGTEAVPELATDWSSEDGLTWTFNLQEGVTFHDGTDFNAEAVCANFERMADQNEVGQNDAVSYYYGNDVGYGDDALIESCTAADELTAEITVSRITGKFPTILTQTSFSMQSPTAMEEYDANDMKAEGEAFVYPEYATDHPTGTGPFKFEAYDDTAGTITLSRNEDYWGEKAKVAKLVFQIIPDETARRQALEAGTIHGYDLPSPTDWQTLEDGGNQVLIRDPFNILYLALNAEADPQLEDPKVRQALMYAINREQMVASQLPEGATVATQFIPDTVDGWSENVETYSYDVDQARSLLEEAGKSDLEIDLWWPTEVTRPYMPDPQRIFNAVKSDWEAAGITVNPVSKPWNGGYIEGTQDGRAPAFFLGWTGDLNSADNFLCAFFCGDSNQFGTAAYDWHDELQQGLRDADAEADEAARTAAYQQLNDKIMSPEWLPGAPLSHSPPAIVVAGNVQGLIPSPLTQEEFATVSITE